jgi:signal transduction histidine kinase
VVRIDRASKRLHHLVEQLIANAVRPGISSRRLTLTRCCTKPPRMSARSSALRNQALKQQWPAEIGSIQADHAKLRDCLNHLLLNSVKFTPNGGTGGTVTGHSEQGAGSTFTIKLPAEPAKTA